MVFCFPCKRLFKHFDDEASTSKTPLTKTRTPPATSAPNNEKVKAIRPNIAIIIYSMYGHIAKSQRSQSCSPSELLLT